ncbi:hypothetical protein ACFY7V_34330 [[Kitasatospora] papulosa]|uniref:Uncharacterized protein n=1 Tax=[Kitasatospora] papulosa TaxID=1464011 RepID=A0ABZ1JV15_9ACTN|nr:hypothetical protein [Streptomyces sp. NRRL S-325]
MVEHAAGGYDLASIAVRTHRVDAVLKSLTGFEGDVLFLVAGWSAHGRWKKPRKQRVLLGFLPGGGADGGRGVRARAV